MHVSSQAVQLRIALRRTSYGVLCAIFVFIVSGLPLVYGQSTQKKAPATPAVPVEKNRPASPAKPPESPQKTKKPTEEERKQKQVENEKKLSEWIEKTLLYGIAKDRRDALNQILTVKDTSVKNKLGNLVVKAINEENDSEVLVKAITVAGEMKLTAAEGGMKTHVDNLSEDVRIAAVNGLKNINATGSKDLLIKKLKEQDLSKDSNFTDALIQTLGEFRTSEMNEFAKASIKDMRTTKNIRQTLVLFLGKAGGAESKDFLLQILKDDDEDKDMRAYAANSLSHLGIREAASELENVLEKIDTYPFKKKKEYYNLQMYCTAALAKLGDERALPRLFDSLKSDNSMVRLRAIKLLREMKDRRSIDILKYKRDFDPNPSVQKAASEALEDMGVKPDDKEINTTGNVPATPRKAAHSPKSADKKGAIDASSSIPPDENNNSTLVSDDRKDSADEHKNAPTRNNPPPAQKKESTPGGNVIKRSPAGN